MIRETVLPQSALELHTLAQRATLAGGSAALSVSLLTTGMHSIGRISGFEQGNE
jgi:hypothetical protein